jgi:hypothetical protein
MELSMTTYIIRIYRRTKDKPEEVVGLVENVDTQDRLPFHDLQELCTIIAEAKIELPHTDQGVSNAEKV